ncbi:MAG: CotH kinase family protein [Fuerstiella sp.]|nr:CotH kinase family protein [Fuerstiella sp.]
MILLTAWPSFTVAQQPTGDPLQRLLLSPEVLLEHRADIGLSGTQVEQIQNRLEIHGPMQQSLQQRAHAAMERLVELLSGDQVDEGGAVKQLDQFLKIENEQKLLHLQVMVQIRNELTEAQLKAAMKIGHQPISDENMEQRLKAKLARIQTEVHSRTERGQHPTDAVGLMQKFPALMQSGRMREADALLDRVLKMLTINNVGATEPERPPARPIDSTLTADGLNNAKAQDQFYRMDEVQTIQLRIAPEDMQRLMAALPERIYVPASFQWRDVTLDNVAVRFKGNSSANPHQRHKRSFLVKFNEYEKDARFFGLRRASFDNGVQFGSLFSEPIITEILRDQGMPTHRSSYARLFLNNEYQGVYVNVERIDETFVDQYLPDADGALFKADVGGPGGNLQFVGDDPSVYKKALEAKSKSAKKDRSQLVDFIRMINQTEPSEFAATLESSFELDDFLRVSAIMLFSGAFDQLTGGGPHNYYLYHDPERNRWRYLPWDLDVGFCETAFGRLHILADWNAAWPLAPHGGPNPLMERIVADPVLLQRYRHMARTILDKYFEPERLSAIVDANYALIKEDLQADPFPHQRVTVPGDHGYDGIVESIKSFMHKRYITAVEQLENPGPRPKVVHRPSGGGNGNLPPQLAEKLQRIEQQARRMQRDGQDVSPIQRLLHKVPALLQQGKLDAAEELFNEALKLTDESSNGNRTESSPE